MAARGGFSLRINQAGIAEVLRSAQMQAAVDAAAAAVAGNVAVRRYPGATVSVRSYVFDRAAASIAFVHPRSHDLQVRDGVLTSAAASAGLEVRSRGAR